MKKAHAVRSQVVSQDDSEAHDQDSGSEADQGIYTTVNKLLWLAIK